MAAPCDEYPLLIMMEYYRRPGGAVNNPGNRRPKSRRGPKTLPHRPKNHRLLLPLITNNQKYSTLSSAAIRAISVKTWEGGGFSAENVSFR